MKPSTWIKFIGILCIVYGGLGIISNIFEILLPTFVGMSEDKSSEISPDQMAWILRLAYIGLAVNAIYTVAGILFLAKKPFSIRLMYAALAISILYHIVPLFMLSRYPSTPYFNYELNISNLISPIIDVVLIAVVMWLRKCYFISYLTNSSRKPLTINHLRAISLIGILCVFIPVSFHLLWIYCFNAEATPLERSALFMSYLPGLLQGRHTITLIGIALCFIAIILSSIGMQSILKSWKVLNILVFSCSILMLLLNLFQMM